MRRLHFFLGTILIVCLSLSSLIFSKGILEERIHKHIAAWQSEGNVIHTTRLTTDQKTALISALHENVNETNLVAVTGQHSSLHGGERLYTFSVLGTPTPKEAFEPLSIMGSTIISSSRVQTLINATPRKYFGYGIDPSNRIDTMPNIRAGISLRIDTLTSGEQVGDYVKFLQFRSNYTFDIFVQQIAKTIGVEASTLTNKVSGSSTSLGIVTLIGGGIFVLLSIIFCLFTVSHSLFELKKLGVHLMLGWSKVDFAKKLFAPYVLPILIIIGLVFGLSLFICDGFLLTPELIFASLFQAIPTILTVFLSVCIAILPILFIHPVDAIASKYSKSGFYLLTITSLCACLIMIFTGSLYMNQPIELYQDMVRTQAAWHNHKDWYVLQDFVQHDERFTGSVNSYAKSMYQWYAEHEQKPGVYLAKTNYVTEDTIKAYLPTAHQLSAFWQLTTSLSYLDELGIPLTQEEREKVVRGERLHLIPKSLDSNIVQELKNYLLASRKVYDSDIVTAYMKSPKGTFRKYSGETSLFTWTTQPNLPTHAQNVVITVVSAQSMVPFESESLTAAGLENSYIKLKKTAHLDILDEKGLATLHATSIKPRFTSVENYISEFRKSLENFFIMTGIIFSLLVLTVCIMIVSIITIINQIKGQEMAIRHMLGFSIWRMYKSQIILLNILIVLGLIVSIVAQSLAGICIAVALFLLVNTLITITVSKQMHHTLAQTIAKEQS